MEFPYLVSVFTQGQFCLQEYIWQIWLEQFDCQNQPRLRETTSIWLDTRQGCC